jgi:hypothetical protein
VSITLETLGREGTSRSILYDSIQGDVSSKAKVKEFYAEIAAKEDRVSLMFPFSWISKAEITTLSDRHSRQLCRDLCSFQKEDG